MHLTKENMYLYSTIIVSVLSISMEFYIVKHLINLITII